MFQATDYDKLQQIMEESPEKKELLTRLLTSHQMTLSAISHEIRNPLTLVYSTLQLIESQHPEVRTFKHWSSLTQDVEYMKLLLEELSAYNNSERIKYDTFDVSTFLKSVALSFATSLVDVNIEFISHIADSLGSITGDCMKLREVILNLLSNARDAVHTKCFVSPEHPLISLNTYIQDATLYIEVKDNGCGIPEENLADLFEPFVTHKTNGTGLGLAIASRIANAHGGSLSVKSIPGFQTTFTLRLPV